MQKMKKIEKEQTSVQSGRNDCAGLTGSGAVNVGSNEARELQPCPEQPVLYCTTDMIDC
jgi:hypothetical protein